MSTTDMTVSENAAGRWLAQFRARPLEALDAVLTGRAHLGAFNTLPPSVALGQLVADPGQSLDTAMLRWLREHWGRVEVEGLRARRYAEALAEALRAVDLLGLPECRRWLRGHAPSAYRWLEALQVGGPATPLDALFATLATAQPDRALEPFWLRLSRLDGQTPLAHGRAALAGLRLLPPEEPSRPAPAATLFGGLIHFAEGLARRGAGPEALFDEIGYFCALQSLTPAALGRPLRKALKGQLVDQQRGLNQDVRGWLEQAVPNAFKEGRQGGGQDERSPMPAEFTDVVNRIHGDGLERARGPLDRLIEGHRRYYRHTGDSYYLVRAFERLSNKLRDLDPGLARDLSHEALRLEPSDHNNWAALGLALDAAGDWTRARAVFWHARRRFPHDPFAHTQLGHALLRHGEDAAALAAYAEAARRFPDNPVAIAGHGHALLELEGSEAALPVLRAGVEVHGDNLPLRNDYTEALIQAGDLAEAERQLAAARRLDQRSDRHNPTLDGLVQRLELARQGRLPMLHRQEPIEIPGGDPDILSDIAGDGLAQVPALGESTLFRHAGELQRAGRIVDGLPAGPGGEAERGLWIAARDGWAAAADWWRGRDTNEAVTRIHAMRSRQRAGESVAWERLERELPQFGPVFRLLTGDELPRLGTGENDPEDLKRDAWLYGEAGYPDRRDPAEEDWLAAAQVI